MHFPTSTLLTAALAGSALAQVREVQIVEVVVRSVTTLKEQPNFIAKRDQAACLSIAEKITSIINTKDLPTANSALATELESYFRSHTNPCDSASFTGSLSSDYSSFAKQASSFYSKYSGAISTYASSVSSACSDIPAVISRLSQLPAVCSTDGASGGSKTTADASGGSKTGAAASATTSGAADALTHGSVPGLAAVAGVLAYLL